MLTGDNGILKRAAEAKERTEEAQEEENVKLSFTEIQMELAQGKEVNSGMFQKIIDRNLGNGKATGTIGGGNYIITITKTGKNYQMNSNGVVSNIEEVPIDFTPGILEGKGTENNPYVINSVEDLLAFAYNVNSKATFYEDEYVTLGRNLDLKDKNSYVDSMTKYSLKQSGSYDLGYIPDETSKYSVIDCMQGCYNGKAFIAIGNYYNSTYFKGKFDGCGHYIKNLDSRFEICVGLFGQASGNVAIKDLGIESGNIQSSDCYAAGILAYVKENSDVLIDNCYNKAQIIGQTAGGIVGDNSTSTSKLIITNCYNSGWIVCSTSRNSGHIGGIVGNYSAFNDGFIENCYNTGNVSSMSGGPVGGICSYSGFDHVKNCYNSGNVNTESGLAGGIISQFGNNSMNISQCYNFGTIHSGNSEANGIGSNYSGYRDNINECYNSGTINSESSTVGACGIATSKNNNTIVTNCHNTGTISRNYI